MNMIYHISPDGNGGFSTVTQALNALAAADKAALANSFGRRTSLPPATFFLHNGTYNERLAITRPHLTFVGESAENTILTYGLYARMPHDDIGKLGTFRSYSCLIDTHDFTAKNLTFQNSAGKGPDVGQALAVYADGDHLSFENCRFLGGQDTLFTGPLPPYEYEPNGFIGPKQFSPRTAGRHYYKNCYLEGDIDFVFGGATAYFEGCRFHSKNIGRKVNSYVTAASTPLGQAYGYVMENCRFTGDCPPHTAYLGRPWREYAQTVLINCYIGPHICEEGWHDWGKTQARQTVLYAEYQSYGPSSNPQKRAPWIHILTSREASRYTKEAVLGKKP